MSDLARQIATPAWWFSVVIAGIVVSLAAAYLKPHVDSALNKVSGTFRARSARKAAARQREIERLRGDKLEQILYAQYVNYARLQGISVLLMGVLLLLMAALPIGLPRLVFALFSLAGSLAGVTGAWASVGAQDFRDILGEARADGTSSDQARPPVEP